MCCVFCIMHNRVNVEKCSYSENYFYFLHVYVLVQNIYVSAKISLALSMPAHTLVCLSVCLSDFLSPCQTIPLCVVGVAHHMHSVSDPNASLCLSLCLCTCVCVCGQV